MMASSDTNVVVRDGGVKEDGGVVERARGFELFKTASKTIGYGVLGMALGVWHRVESNSFYGSAILYVLYQVYRHQRRGLITNKKQGEDNEDGDLPEPSTIAALAVGFIAGRKTLNYYGERLGAIVFGATF